MVVSHKDVKNDRTYQSLEGGPEEKQVRRLLIALDLAQGDCTRLIALL